MASSKYEDLWQLLTRYDFKEDIPDSFHCTICSKVTIDPYIAVCGCRFCFRCIDEYLKDGRKYCPGGNEYCMEEYLELEVNVTKHVISVRQIKQLEVKCPNNMCNVRCGLESLSDHLKVCRITDIRSQSLDFEDKEMISEEINNLKNEIGGLKEGLNRRDVKIRKLEEDSQRNENVIDALKTEVIALKNADMLKVMELRMIKDELRRIKDEQSHRMAEELRNIKKEIMDIVLKEDIRDQRKRLDELVTNQEDMHNKIHDLTLNVKQLEIYDETEFTWRMNHFSKIREDGRIMYLPLWKYCMKFSIEVRSFTDPKDRKYNKETLKVLCRIMKGDYDDKIIYPMKYTITLRLMNQYTMEPHAIKEYNVTNQSNKSSFDKPSDKANYFAMGGDTYLATMEDVLTSPGIVVNNSIIISFRVDYQ